MLDQATETRMRREHHDKYDALAHWLGVPALLSLVPFPADRIRAALATGDEHLNTLPLASWDAQHGQQERRPVKCRCCDQTLPQKPHTGVYDLYIAARVRDRRAGLPDRYKGWALCETVCVLKHVARHYLATQQENTDNA